MSGGRYFHSPLRLKMRTAARFAPATRSPRAPANGAINEDMASLDELLNQLVDTDDAEEAKDNDEE